MILVYYNIADNITCQYVPYVHSSLVDTVVICVCHAVDGAMVDDCER